MSVFKRWFGSEESRQSPQLQPKSEPSARDVAKDPVLFADWINQYFVLSRSFEEDLDVMAPDEEECKRLQISTEERMLCANECVLLRALGACLFVRNNFDEKYYIAFRDALLPPVVERMKRNAPYLHHDDPADALERYLEDLKSDSQVGFSMTFISRVYPKTPRAEAIFLQGIPVHLGFAYVMNAFKMVRDRLSILSTGVRYEALEKVHEVLEQQRTTDPDETG
jgi:hypothetical protein